MPRSIVHIAYGDSAAGCLKEAILHHPLEGDRVVVSRDNFTVGPLQSAENHHYNHRKHYWTQVMKTLHIDIDIEQSFRETMADIDTINHADVILWQGDSAHDILATAWIIRYLHQRQVRFYMIDLAQEVKNTLSWPLVNVAMLIPEHLPEIYTRRIPLIDWHINRYNQIWDKVAKENAAFRVFDNGQLVSVPEVYHDDFILEHIPPIWEKASKVIGNILGESNHRLSDVTVDYRLRQLIQCGLVEYDGELRTMRDFRIRKG